MKKTISTFIGLLFCLSNGFSQGNAGNTWVMGQGILFNPTEPAFGGSIIHFSPNGVETNRFDMDYEMALYCSISDQEGKLLFYSNGCEVYDKTLQIMQGGEAIAAGASYDLVCTGELGVKLYNAFQDMLILPWPGQAHKYMAVYIFYNEPYVFKSEIRKAVIDMTGNGGLGTVIEKNTPVFQGKTSYPYMTATRHANGKDWWVALPEYDTNHFFVFLLDSLGLHGPDIQPVGYFDKGLGGAGQASFSPDGSKFAQVVFYTGQLMDFNRCTGKFSNARPIEFDTLRSDFSGVGFSPDSRYMYVSQARRIYQYDLSEEAFNESSMMITSYDEAVDPVPQHNPYFYTMLTAPDDKIYINCPGSTEALHVIHHPNERGVACGFEKSALVLPTFHFGQMPNLPNFRLGALDPPCGECDTLLKTPAFTIFPNPAKDYVIVSNPSPEKNTGLTFRLFDALGRLVKEETICCLPHRVDLQGLPAAGYIYHVFNANGKEFKTGCLVKIN